MKDLLIKLVVQYGEVIIVLVVGVLTRWFEKSWLNAKIKELQSKIKDLQNRLKDFTDDMG